MGEKETLGSGFFLSCASLLTELWFSQTNLHVFEAASIFLLDDLFFVYILTRFRSSNSKTHQFPTDAFENLYKNKF